MKKRDFNLFRYISIGICFTVFFTAIFILADQGKCGQTLTMGFESWEPYQYVDDNQTVTGLDVELILAIATDAGYSISLEEIPWERQLEYLKSGDVQLATGASRTIDREQYAYFSDPYRTESVRLYVRKGEACRYPFNCLKDLVGSSFQLGVSRGYYYGEEYATLIMTPEFRSHVQEVSDDTFNYQKLMLQHIDGFFADPMSFNSVLRRKGLSGKIEAHPMAIYSSDIFIMFSKKSVSPQTVEAFNKSLIRIKNSDQYRQILQKYLEKN